MVRARDELAARLTLFLVTEVPLDEEVLALRVAVHALAVASKLRVVGRQEAQSRVHTVNERLDLFLVAKDHAALPVRGDRTEVDHLYVAYRVDDLGTFNARELAHDAPLGLFCVRTILPAPETRAFAPTAGASNLETVLECVINISEGRDLEVLDALAASAGASLRDRHYDSAHHRSVFTLINEPDLLELDVRNLVQCAFNLLTLAHHDGVHPRLGVVDVVPYVALDPRERELARQLRDETARWIAHTFDMATFLYGVLEDGSERTLPEVRRLAFRTLAPDYGPGEPSPLLGAVAVGERPVLVAWNLWLADTSPERARELARRVRGPYVRALGLDVGDQVQVSCNLLDVTRVAPSVVFDHVRGSLEGDEHIARSELVGLAPRSLLEQVDPDRWSELDLSLERTIEAALERGSAGL